MANKEVAFKIVVDTSEVGASVKKTTKGVEELGDATKKTTKEMGGGFSAASDNAKQLGGSLGGATGAALGFAAGIKSMTLAALAFLATPLGMALAAIGVVVGSIIGIFKTFFGETERGAQKLRVIMAGLGAVMGSLKDVIIGVAEAMIKFVKGDFSGSINTLKNSFTGLGDEIAKDVKGAIELENAMNKVKVAERELGVERAKTLTIIGAARLAAEDETKSAQERVEALKLAAKLEGEITDKQLNNAQEKLRVMREQADLNETNEEGFKALADQEIAVSQIQLSSLNLNRRLKTEINSLERSIETERAARATAEQTRIKTINEEQAKAAAAEIERLKKETEELEKQADIKFALEDKVAAHEVDIYKQLQDAKIALMEDGEAKELALAKLMLERRLEGIMGASEMERQLRDQLEAIGLIEKQAIIDKYKNEEIAKKKESDKILIDTERAVIAARISMAQSVGSILGSISSMINKETQAGLVASKVLAVAQIAIDTATAISGAISSASKATNVYEMIAGIAAGIAAVTSGIASATSILNSANVPGPSATTPSISNVSTSAPSFNPVTTNTTELGNTQAAELAPIQAFVVETAITGSQNNIGQIEGQATFGNPG
jgi:hypothetical protein